MKTEKLSMLTDFRLEKFLNNLPNPIELNQMRSMKDEKYGVLRKLLSKYMGSPILRVIKDNQRALDLDPEVFDLVYEGFWDLYTLRPAIRDVSARKLQSWIQKIKLTSGPERGESEPAADAQEQKEDDGDEEDKKPAAEINLDSPDVIDPIAAVVRLKIPKVPLEPELDDEGNEIQVEVNESDLEDIPFEDRCLTMVAKMDEQRVWVINHLAQRTLRSELSAEFRATVEKLDNLDTSDFNYRLEREAMAFEDALLKLMNVEIEDKEEEA